MDKAEKRALEAYPIEICGYVTECRVGAKPEPQDWNEERRKCFQEGYEVAEKDLELTWEDMKTIIELDGNVGECDDFHGSQKYYEKVLEIFNEKKYGKRIHT